jgi:hypothetical protein
MVIIIIPTGQQYNGTMGIVLGAYMVRITDIMVHNPRLTIGGYMGNGLLNVRTNRDWVKDYL